jgi:hypothetical protein
MSTVIRKQDAVNYALKFSDLQSWGETVRCDA